jgi:ammonia channel protein AmtB
MTSNKNLVLYSVFLVLFAVPAFDLFTHMKWLPQVCILGLFLLYALLHLCLVRSPSRHHLAVPLVVLLFAGSAVDLFIRLLLWLSPPVTSDGHPVMAIGQVFGGLLIGIIAAGLLTYFYFWKLGRDPKLEAWVVHIIGGILLIAFLADRLLDIL